MKVYVHGYRTATDEEREEARRRRPFDEVGVVVAYSGTPTWTMEQYGADIHLETLRRMGIHVGQHHCDFSIEELPDKKLAIVCAEHPDSRGLTQSAATS